MRRIELHSIPTIWFAHTFSVPQYESLHPCRENSIEITCVTEGRVQATVEGIQHTACKGDILVNTFDHAYHFYAKDPHTHHTVAFWADFTLGEEVGTYLPIVTPFGTTNHTASRLIDKIIYTHTANPEAELTCAGLVLELLGELHTVHRQRLNRVSPGEVRYVQEAKRFILDNLNRPITQREVAQQLGISPEYLCALFKKTENETVISFINRIKLGQIRTLMERDGLKLYQAAELCGYSDPNYVSRLFKKYYQMSSRQLKQAEEAKFR